jgi:hypothetical protein
MSSNKKEQYYAYLDELRKDLAKLHARAFEATKAMLQSRKTLAELNKKIDIKQKRFNDVMELGVEKWQPNLIQQADYYDGKTAATESKKEYEF